MNAPVDYDVDRYMEIMFARAPFVARHFDMTSEISYGKFHDGIFYGPGTKELLLSTEEPFYVSKSLLNWKSLAPVTVLDHPVSNLGLLVPDGNKNNSEVGRATISINIPLLMLQFRQFALDQLMKKSNVGDSLLDIKHFVRMYVLPNMLYSHTDIAVFNRLDNLKNGIPMGESLKKLPFHVLEYDDKIDRVLKVILRHLTRTPMRYSQDLKNIFAIFAADMDAALQMPNLAPTRQVWWALIMTRMKAMRVLLQLSQDKNYSNNNTYINHLKIALKRISYENVMNSLLDEDDRIEFEEFNKLVASM
jgi:hypothetical protein